MRSLWTKLVGAFVLVVIIGIALVVVLVSQTTTGQFELYITHMGQQWATRLAPVVADYYAHIGSWDGVEVALRDSLNGASTGSAQRRMGMGQGLGRGGNGGMMNALSTDRLILAQADGTVVLDTASQLVGSRLQPETEALGAAIILDDARLGTLIVTPLDTPSTPAGDFLGAVRRSALLAGAAAVGLALLLGTVMFVQMTRPLRSLSEAAQGIADGDLSRRVQVGSRDEVGQVAVTFNQMADTLQRYEVERRNMIGDIAHELRTPLSVIQGNIEAMIDGVLPVSPEELGLLHQETLLLNRLIADLRILAQAEAGQLHLQMEPVEPGELVQQVAERMQLRADEKHIRLETEIANPLPNVIADRDRLVQIMTNLVDNALRYNPTGTQVRIGASSSTDRVELSVRDDGPGIPAHELPHLFDRFWRAEKSRNRSTGGSGLGLAIVRQLVEAHHGEVHVESEAGKGTRFVVLLPAA